MSVRTNTANGGYTYIDMDIQVVSTDASQYTFRAVIYLTSRNVSDSTNNCSVTGQWSRGGALALGGVYNQAAVWYQDVSFGRNVGSSYQVGWNLSWSAVDYWGVTLSGTAYATIDGTYGVPSTPYGYSARNITTSSAYTANVSVADVAGGAWNNLQVQWATNSAMSGASTRVMGSWTDGFMDNLAPGTQYYFRVAVANTYYWSAWGGVVGFVSAAAPPGAPTPNADAITATSARVYISTAGAENGAAAQYCQYHVYKDPENVVIADVGGGGGIGYAGTTITGLAKATQYRVFARTYNAAGWGAWSPTPKTFTTLATVPDTMAAPTVSAITTTTATVSYVAPGNGGSAITGYSIQYATNAAFTTGLVSQANGTLTGLVPSTNYWTRVAAVNAVGPGAWSPATAFTSGATSPAAVAAPTISLITDSEAQVTWTAPNPNGAVITNYNIQISKNSGFTSLFWEGQLGNVLVTQLALLNPTTPYWVRLAAVNAQGTGAWGTATTFTTLSGLFYNDHGNQKRSDLYLRDVGTWKLCELWENVAGTWRKIS